jgi:glyoxylate reductase
MVPRVLLTSPLPVDPASFLPGVEVVAVGDRAELEAALPGADGLMCLLVDTVDADLLARAPRLRVVGNYAVGVDNIDVAEATRLGIAVVNTPDVLTDATADLTMALLLGFARRLAEGEAALRAGAWHGFDPTWMLGMDLAGKTLGLVGFGRIGRAVARRARGFGLKIAYASNRQVDEPGCAFMTLPELLARADFLSLHVPLTPATRGLIDADKLALMKPGAVLINTARGGCVDEDAVAAALESGHLGGAALDVFVREPHVSPRLLKAPRALLLPHLGSATKGTRARMVELCARGVGEVLAGRRPTNLVEPSVTIRGRA